MKCTSPCFPKCLNEATTELLSLNNSHLGYNCDSHILPLRFEKTVVNGNTLNPEYKKVTLPEELTPFEGWNTDPTTEDIIALVNDRKMFSTGES